MISTKALKITFDDPYRTPLPCVINMVVVGKGKKDWLSKIEEFLGQPVKLYPRIGYPEDCFSLKVGDIYYAVTVETLYNVYL